MRIGLFFGAARRNDPVRLENPRPLPDTGRSAIESGNAALDGFTVLSRAQPDAQGNPPPVAGTLGQAHQGPDNSFEQ
jgi:hypothetical protein